MTVFDDMVATAGARTEEERICAAREVMQRIALAGLSRGGFFAKAAFYGGTCLHLFHGLRRFSEDMDFSLLVPDPAFAFEDFFDAVKKEFSLAGKEVEIVAKRRGRPTSIESAFLKESSDVYDIGFTTEKRMKIKLEVDIDPPPRFTTEMKLQMMPSSCWIRTYDLPGLFAGKASAALFRKWRTRVKGRDWYDLAWYVAHGAELDLAHLVERVKESAPGVDLSTPQAVVAAFDTRIDSIDFTSAREDVLPFIDDASELDIWGRGYFKAVVRQIRFCRT